MKIYRVYREGQLDLENEAFVTHKIYHLNMVLFILMNYVESENTAYSL